MAALERHPVRRRRTGGKRNGHQHPIEIRSPLPQAAAHLAVQHQRSVRRPEKRRLHMDQDRFPVAASRRPDAVIMPHVARPAPVEK